MEGGAAMLAAHPINHIVAIEGISTFTPLFIDKLRDLDISYI